ncbi:MAG: Flp1 family type IVb pilin [Acutalibacteraceae bacterium]|nr:Flp1 family type IVb pilin [Acutalibacteraceae bacterium]
MKLLVFLWNWWIALTGKVRRFTVKTAAAAAAGNTGEINIVAMVLIIIVVIALVAIFRSEMTDIVTKRFEKIRSGMEL